MGSESQATRRNDPPPSAAQVMHLRARDSAGLACLTHALVADGRATLRRRVEPATVPHSPTREEATR